MGMNYEEMFSAKLPLKCKRYYNYILKGNVLIKGQPQEF